MHAATGSHAALTTVTEAASHHQTNKSSALSPRARLCRPRGEELGVHGRVGVPREHNHRGLLLGAAPAAAADA